MILHSPIIRAKAGIQKERLAVLRAFAATTGLEAVQNTQTVLTLNNT